MFLPTVSHVSFLHRIISINRKTKYGKKIGYIRYLPVHLCSLVIFFLLLTFLHLVFSFKVLQNETEKD